MRITASLIATALAVLVAGCGSDDKPASSADAAPAAATAPYGSYTRSITDTDIERTQNVRDESGPEQAKPKPSAARLVIAKGSGQDVLRVTDERGGFSVAMDLGVEGDELKLYSYVNPMQGAWCGPQIAEAAAYTYEMQGDGLVLEPAHPDGCADRDATLTGTWKKG
jgi:hypothetical protein